MKGVDSEDMNDRKYTETVTTTASAMTTQIDSHRAAAAGSMHGNRAASGSQFEEDSDTDDLFSDHGSPRSDPPSPNHIEMEMEEEEEKKEMEDMKRPKTNEIISIPKQKRRSRKLTETQNILVFSATKYALLCGSAVLVLDLQFLSQAIYNMGKERFGVELFIDIWFWFVLLLMFYTIYLSFPTTTEEYKRVCGKLHGALEGIFRRNMKSEIAKKEAEQKNEAKSVCCCRLNQSL